MNAPDGGPMICPQCRSENTMRGATGNGLCFDCRFEWNPDELVAGPAPVIAPFAMATVNEVFGPPPGVDDAAALRADADFAHELAELTEQVDHDAALVIEDLIGQLATLEGGQICMVVDLIDENTIGVAISTGEIVHVRFDDVERIVPMPAEMQAMIDAQQGDQHTEAQ